MTARYFVWEGGGAALTKSSDPERVIGLLRQVYPEMLEVERDEYEEAEAIGSTEGGRSTDGDGSSCGAPHISGAEAP